MTGLRFPAVLCTTWLALTLATHPVPAAAQGSTQTPVPTRLSALAPENLAKARPKPPFDLTGNWFIDNSERIQGWLFGPATIPKLTPAAQKHRDAYVDRKSIV